MSSHDPPSPTREASLGESGGTPNSSHSTDSSAGLVGDEAQGRRKVCFFQDGCKSLFVWPRWMINKPPASILPSASQRGSARGTGQGSGPSCVADEIPSRGL